jgi:transcriptional regulator with XRE-family HTH domain
MKLQTNSTSLEIDGDKLRIAREELGLSQHELATKLCLSYVHIAQLEDDRLTIFFSPAHKIQVAKKAGAVLGLQELEYLIPKNIQLGSAPPHSERISQLPTNGLHLDPNLAPRNQDTKRKSFPIPSVLLGMLAIFVVALIYYQDT